MNKIIVFLLFVNVSFAQTKTTAKIKSVSIDGLHVMKLPSELRSFSKDDLSDLRIFDAKNQEIPYFIYENERNVTSNNFETLKIISKVSTPNKKTEIIFVNKPSTDFIIEIANTQGQKKYEISGSDDQKNWFGLTNKDNIDLEKSTEKTSIFVTFEIPFNEYQFVKITFDDQKTLPINVLNIGTIKSTIIENSLEMITPKKITTNHNKATKKTLIDINFINKATINQISFKISNPKLFHREATLFYNDTIIRKKKKEILRNVIAVFDLKPTQKNSFLISETFAKELFIEIDNQDNLPLTIDEVNFFQNQKFIVSELKAQENYKIITGNNNLIAPNYDLKYFEETMQKKLPETQIFDIKNEILISKSDEKPFFQPWMLWLCIGIGAVVALYFVSSLLKDMNKS